MLLLVQQFSALSLSTTAYNMALRAFWRKLKSMRTGITIFVYVGILLLIGFGPMGATSTGQPFHRIKCYNRILQNPDLAPGSTLSPGLITVPLAVCESVCGTKVARLSNWADSIFSWIWPVVFLVASMPT